MGVGPGQSLSCPHSAHSGSRDLPRGIGGPPKEAGLAVAQGGNKHTDSSGPRKILLLLLFFGFILFCCLLLFLIYFLFSFFLIF